MSNCGYYSCFKGKPTCKHPNIGDYCTEQLQNHRNSGMFHPCDMCKRSNLGLYPSQVPHLILKDEGDGEVVELQDGSTIYVAK